jgi:hypothetical protein
MTPSPVRRWAERDRLAEVGMTRRGPYSVSDAVRDYLEEITAEKSGRPVLAPPIKTIR